MRYDDHDFCVVNSNCKFNRDFQHGLFFMENDRKKSSNGRTHTSYGLTFICITLTLLVNVIKDKRLLNIHEITSYSDDPVEKSEK